LIRLGTSYVISYTELACTENVGDAVKVCGTMVGKPFSTLGYGWRDKYVMQKI